MSAQPDQLSHDGIDAVHAALQAGRHLTPSGESITLRAFRQQFAGCTFSPKAILDTYYPDTAQAMRAASLAKVGGHRNWVPTRPDEK